MAITRELTNTTVTDIFINDTGVTLPLSATITIDHQNYALWGASVDIDTHLTTGDVTFALNGTTLTADQAKAVIHEISPFITAKTEGSITVAGAQGINLKGNVTGAANGSDVDYTIGGSTGNLGSMFVMAFSKLGVSKNSYLSLETNGLNSNETSGIIPFGCNLVAIVFTNTVALADVDVEIRRAAFNAGTTTDTPLTHQVRLARINAKNDLSISFASGDKIGIFMADQGTDPRDVAVTLYFKITNEAVFDDEESYSGSF